MLTITVETTFGPGGRPVSAYVHVAQGKVAVTQEIRAGSVMADFDEGGNLLGVELLAPVSTRALSRIKMSPQTRKAIRQSVPHGLLITAQ